MKPPPFSVKKFYAILTMAGISFTATAQLVYKDVAPVFYNRCTSCHHPGGHPPEHYTSYSETVPWVSLIQTDLSSGKMPPWSPDTTYTRFLHERIIKQSEKNTIINWINAGYPAGDTTLAPPAPVYNSQYQLYGTPSLVLQIPTFTSNATTTDAYNCFALPSGLTQDRILRAYEIVPGNVSIVHHVIVNIDTTGTVASDLSGTCFNASGDFGIGGYAPGAPPTVFPGVAPLKIGMRIKAGSKFILQIHYPAGTGGQRDSTKIRIYFYPANETGIRPIYTSVPLQNWSMPIPANTVQTFTAKYPSSGGLTAALSIFSTFPHSHKVCTSILNYADNGTTTIPLIRINKWDFNWQGYYTYPKLVKIPTGYTLRASHVYDNTTSNPNNPNNPPQLVTAGTSTTNEMLFDAFQWLYYLPGDETIDIGGLLVNDSLLNPNATAVNEHSLPGISSFTFPNPFSDRVRIRYELVHPSEVSISIYNIVGTKIKTLSDQLLTPGEYANDWDGRNEAGEKVPAGIYFYTMHAGKSESSGKIVLMPK
jgi:hypothetical protein